MNLHHFKGAHALSLIGRVLLALLFLASGLGKLAAPVATQGYIAAVGVPQPMLTYGAAVIVEVAFGLFLLVGYRARMAALVLAGFTVVATILFHSNLADQNQFIHVMKNLAIIGGLLHVAATGTRPFGSHLRMLGRGGSQASAG